MTINTLLPNPPAPDDPLKKSDPKKYYQDLFSSLEQAYFAATTTEAKLKIQIARDDAYTILTTITQAQITQDTTGLDAIQDTVTKNNAALEALQTEIGGLVNDIQVAADVEIAIANVLSLAGELAV
ncbi:hypothetical protein [Granulicella tundricola]|uniref:Uncharacterized protein n=1 Tax=Granulicella tundricola (strain ATCC BAA-1859 / DSM 23138 / MP5ACTX9) TaxID=1198114 RepID=E8WZ74_GRATM|nr:hypothetical protein [Granulicella tundricola]ADW67676.1 hypothetical protein AciX9_0605 [Granulicella tundricola MP5ACTX9]